MKVKGDFFNEFSQIDLPLHGVRLPSFSIENKYKRSIRVSESCTNYEFLRALCESGLKNLKVKNPKAYQERLDYELDIINELSFVDYILLVWDVINYCKEEDIPVGLGRGSAAGSLVLYCIGVTGIDPLKYDLYFERFISKIRAKKKVVDGVTYLDGSLMCDVDLDICYYNRPKVIQYLYEKFEGKTSKILTFNTLSGKLLMKECGKIVGGKSEVEMNTVTAMIPKTFGIVKDIEEAYGEVEKFKEWCDENSDAYSIALSLRGLVKNKGVHPSGILVSYDPLEKSCPTELSSDKESVSSYDMNWSSVFNVKLDILGLRGVSVADDVCKMVGINLRDIDLTDPTIYQQFQHLSSPHGLFQIEAPTNFKVCQKVKPKNLEELSAVLALARPGALAYVDQYAAYTNEDEYQPIHPFFDDILSSTGGVALYQEQLMKMAHKIGFTLDEAELLRRIVGKKKTAEVRKWKKKIKDKVKENNLEKEVADILWKVLEDSAHYSFNKSHSLAYAALAAATVYLKFKYPKEFFLSLLKMSRHEPDPIKEISIIQKELDNFNILLLPPHIIKSDMDFIIEDDDIRFGLLSIKGISDKSIEKLNNFRNKYANKFEIFQAAEQAGLNIGNLSALIQAGALEGFSQSRSKVVYESQVWNILTRKEKNYVLRMAEQYDYDLVKIVKKLINFKGDDNKVVIKESRVGTIKKKAAPYKQIFELNSKSESFANWYYEKKLLGYTYGVTLRDIWSRQKGTLRNISDIPAMDDNDNVCFIGTVEESFSRVSKNGNKYLKMLISDESGFMECMIFNKNMEECEIKNNGLPKDGNIVIISGRKKEDVVFAHKVGVQDQKVYTKLSELKALNSK
jgi:DNA polymerase-3 subunit alpha